MKVLDGSKKLKRDLKYPIVTLGNYDGVHKAHQHIIKKVVSSAKKHSGSAILYTFEPHPVKLLAPKLTPHLLQTRRQKISKLEELGIDFLVIEPFTKSLAKLNSEDFFEKIIIGRLNAKEIIVGYDFTFGEKRSGTVRKLRQLAEKNGIKVHIIEPVFQKESLLSSTHIRRFIEKGNTETAKKMLGRPYSIEGVVVKGRGIGAELGFHTANLSTENEIIPPPGVYITSTELLENGKLYKSVTNIGYNPTFQGTDLSIETYILNFRGNLRRKRIEISFHKKIRREMTFESADHLRLQIEKDVLIAREYHEKRI